MNDVFVWVLRGSADHPGKPEISMSEAIYFQIASDIEISG